MIHRLGRGELHARGEFVAADPGVEPGVTLARGGVFAIQPGHYRVRRLLALG